MITADLSTETLQDRRDWQDILKVMEEKNLQPNYYTQQGSHSNMKENQKLYRQAKAERIQHHQTSSGTPLQYSCLENPMDGGAWWAAVHGVAKSPIRLSDFTFTFHFHTLEKEMVTHSVFLPGESHGRGSLVGCSPRGH